MRFFFPNTSEDSLVTASPRLADPWSPDLAGAGVVCFRVVLSDVGSNGFTGALR